MREDAFSAHKHIMKKESIFLFFFEVLQTLQIPYRDTPDKQRHVTSCIPTNWLNHVDPFFSWWHYWSACEHVKSGYDLNQIIPSNQVIVVM